MFCSNCAQKIDSGERFCSKCGAPAEKSVNIKKGISPITTMIIILGGVVLIAVVVLAVVLSGRSTQKTLEIKGSETTVAVTTTSPRETTAETNAFNMKVLIKTSLRDQSMTNEDALDKTQLIISSRLKALGINRFKIDRDYDNNFIIQIQMPKDSDSQKIITVITKTCLLEFKIVEELEANGNYKLGPTLITGDKLISAKAGYDSNGNIVVQFSFNSEGAKEFEKITSENIGKQLAIVLDDQVKSAPVIRSAIADDGEIESIGTIEEAKDIALALQTGALPVNLEILDIFLE